MTFFFNGTQANVTLTSTGATISSIPQPAATQTVFTKYVVASATGTTIHTVTAGKTFYCTGCYLNNNAAGSATIGVAVNGTTVLRMGVATLSCTPLSGGILFTAAAGQAIANFSDGGNSSVGIWGYEA